MKNLRMSAKIIASFSIVMVLVIIMSVVSTVNLNSLYKSIDTISNYETPGLYYLGQINTALRGMRSEMRAMVVYVNVNDHELYDNSKATLYRYEAETKDNITQYKTTIRTTEGQSKFDTFQKAYDAYAATIDSFVAICEEWNAGNAVTALNTLTAPLDATLNASGDLLQYIRTLCNNEIAVSESRYRTTTITSYVLLAAAILMIIMNVVYLSSLITKPLNKMKAVLDQVADTGSMEFTPEIIASIEEESKYKDELGTSLHSFDRMMEHFLDMTHELDYISKGDLSRTVRALSPNDTMANAMNALLANINAMFGDINLSSNQVATGAKQIADGSQTLAQGSTEQASSVEELSSSIADVADSIRGAANSAQNAANLADNIKSRAAQGAEQMTLMMEAVQGIAEASQSISKVIAVIDNIAFQTNILALNASVEAAHAGEHGRGFAVVADEVRQLASKSAEAAKDTSSLIENSIQKAELGARIAGDTNASLQEIIEGINQSNQLVAEIARSAEAQASSISQINIGIDQVAQVVQQNSATAQESAAASQEMSSQSQILQDLIAQFRLKEERLSQRMIASQAPTGRSSDTSRDDGYSGTGAGYGKY